MESVVAVQPHGLGVVVQDGECGDMEVTEHGIGFPASDEANKVLVDLGDEEGHGATGSKRFSGDVTRLESKRGAGSCYDALDQVGDMS